jgi:hypothetical protein
MTVSRGTPTTWFGVITHAGRELTYTVLVAVLIAAATVLSVLFPPLGSWVFMPAGLLAIAWYTHMMRRWRELRADA